MPCTSPQAPMEEKGPPGAESIPAPCLWEEDFPGTSSPAPFAIQHSANTMTPPGGSVQALSPHWATREMSHLSSHPRAQQLFPTPSRSRGGSFCNALPHESKSLTKQEQEKKPRGGGEEGEMVSKPGHIKRLFPWQLRILTVAQVCFHQQQRLPIKVCPGPRFLPVCPRWDGQGRVSPEGWDSFGKRRLLWPWGSVGVESWGQAAVIATRTLEDAMQRSGCAHL